MDATKETLSTLLGILTIAGGCTLAIMYTDLITMRRTDVGHRKEIEAMQASADAMREQLQIKSQIISTLERSAERVTCREVPAPLATVTAAAEPAPRKTEPKPTTLYVYRTKQADCRKPSPFCNLIGCGHD